MQRILSLWLPMLAIERTARLRRVDQPLALTVRRDGRTTLMAVDAAAASLGLRPGDGLPEVRALDVSVRLLEADAGGDRRAIEDLADWCGQYLPRAAVELDGGAGGILLDASHGTQAFGGEAALLQTILRRLRGFGYTVHGAVAGTLGAAWALARFDGRAATGLVADGDLLSVLAPLPVGALRIGVAADALARRGWERIGDLAGLSPALVDAEAGPRVLRRLDQALGAMAETLVPRRAVAPCRVRHGFADPVGLIDPLRSALRKALGELTGRLERADRGVRRIELALYRLDGGVRRLPVELTAASRDADLLMRLLDRHLDKFDLSAGIESLVLSALDTEQARPVQLELGPNPRHALDSVLDRLAERLATVEAARQLGRPAALDRRLAVPARRALSGRPLPERPAELARRRQD